jgi:hypothetical protein
LVQMDVAVAVTTVAVTTVTKPIYIYIYILLLLVKSGAGVPYKGKSHKLILMMLKVIFATSATFSYLIHQALNTMAVRGNPGTSPLVKRSVGPWPADLLAALMSDYMADSSGVLNPGYFRELIMEAYFTILAILLAIFLGREVSHCIRVGIPSRTAIFPRP